LLPALKALEEIERNRQADDDYLLKPSRVNRTFVADKIDAAIDALNSAPKISTRFNAQRLLPISMTRSGNKEERPLWKKVIGAR